MIERLYFEKTGGDYLTGEHYKVVCDDLYVNVVSYQVYNWTDEVTGVSAAIEVLSEPHRNECEHDDDIAGVRVGYKPLDLLGVAYGGEVRVVPAFQLARTIERLTVVTE